MCRSDLHPKADRCESTREKVYVGFMNLEKAYYRINNEVLWQVLRMCDVGGKVLNSIRNMLTV